MGWFQICCVASYRLGVHGQVLSDINFLLCWILSFFTIWNDRENFITKILASKLMNWFISCKWFLLLFDINKFATCDNHMVLNSYDNHMIFNMVIIWLSYLNFSLKTYDNHVFVKVWLSYNNHVIILCKSKHDFCVSRR